MSNFKEQLKRIHTLVFDYDGVFTDGVVFVTGDGNEPMRTSFVRDGFAVQKAVKKGLTLAVITGGRNTAVIERMNKLGVKYVYTHVEDKKKPLKVLMKTHGMKSENVLYMGDDLPDIPAMELAGVRCCPADAVEEVKELCHYISHRKGGHGAVRDVIEQVLKSQNLWMNENRKNDVE